MKIGLSLNKEEVRLALAEYARAKAIDLKLAPIDNMREVVVHIDTTAYVEVDIRKGE